jgi:hypothetical protein
MVHYTTFHICRCVGNLHDNTLWTCSLSSRPVFSVSTVHQKRWCHVSKSRKDHGWQGWKRYLEEWFLSFWALSLHGPFPGHCSPILWVASSTHLFTHLTFHLLLEAFHDPSMLGHLLCPPNGPAPLCPRIPRSAL